MKKYKQPIDTSDWSIVHVKIGNHVIEERTVLSEQWHRDFCEKYGYKLVDFKRGTNPLCA